MPSPLEHLDTESTLLLYVVGELPIDARRAMDQRLVSDASLRDQLDQIRASYDGIAQTISEADSRERLALQANTAARRVGVAVKSWHARRLASPTETKVGGNRYPWWAYPLATAAVIAIGFMVYFAKFQKDPLMVLNPLTPPNATAPSDSSPEDAQSPTVSAENVELAMGPVELYSSLRDDSDNVLNAAEADAYALSQHKTSVAEIPADFYDGGTGSGNGNGKGKAN